MTFDTNKLRAIITAVLALFAALYLGIAAATAQLEAVAWILGAGLLITCLLLGKRIWMLIPLLGASNFALPVPGTPSLLLIAQGLFLGMSLLLILMRRLDTHFRFETLEFWMLMVVAMVLQVYVRNPVSIGVLGGDTLGGKAYFIFGFSVIAGGLLATLRIPSKDLAKILPLTLIGWAIHFLMTVTGVLFPSIGAYYGAAYLKEEGAIQAGPADEMRAEQKGGLNPIGARVMTWISAYISPLKACFSPRWIIIVLFSFAIAGMSGFRSAVGLLGLTALVGICYRGGFISILISGVIGAFALAAIALTNSLVPLPPNIQRSFAFLPGTWDQYYIDTTESSTDWRVEVWKEVLLTDRWISNKWLGDGLGFTKQELMMQQMIGEAKGQRLTSGFDAHREAILANGDYHSGPVQTIRTIGYVGLVVLLCAMIALAREAHRQIIRTRGTEWHPLALIIGIPIIVSPLFFIFIFGTFKDASSSLMMGYGILSLFKRNLPLPHYVKPLRHAPPLIVNKMASKSVISTSMHTHPNR